MLRLGFSMKSRKIDIRLKVQSQRFNHQYSEQFPKFIEENRFSSNSQMFAPYPATTFFHL